MPEILHSRRLPDGHELHVVTSASRGGSQWHRPVAMRLVETRGGQYTHSRGRNVVRVIETREVDGRCTGHLSGYHAAAMVLCQRMAEEARNYRPGEVMPPGVPVVTVEMLSKIEAQFPSDSARRSREVTP